MLRAVVFAACAASTLAYAPAASRVVSRRAASHNVAVHMDETLFENVLGDELEREGAEKPWLSEAGWAVYLDSQDSGYAMNNKVSEDFKYFTAGIFSNPFEIIGDFFDGLDGMTTKMFRTTPKYAEAEKPQKSAPAAKSGGFNFFNKK